MAEGGPVEIEALLEARQPKAGAIKIIGVDGHGGSGKSTVAELLASRLRAQIIHTDDFAGWDNPKNWWPQLIDQVLEPIAAGAKTVSYARSRWWPDHHPEPVVDQPVTPVMVLEGVSALRKEFRRYLTLGIYVAVPYQVCLERGVTRDAAQGTEAEVTKRWEQWLRDEEDYIQRDHPELYADILLDGTQPIGDQLDLSTGTSGQATPA